MKKMLAVGLISIFCITSSAASFAGSTDLKQWNYYKEIGLSGNNKYKSMTLDNEVYKYAKTDLSDLRIVDEKGETVPYYIDDGIRTYNDVDHRIYSSTLLDSHKEKNNTITDFYVNTEEQGFDVLADYLNLKVNSSNDFLKNIEIYGSYDGVKWEFIKNDNIYSVQKVEKDRVELPQTYKFKYYRIKAINDLDQAKLIGMNAGFDNIKVNKQRSEEITPFSKTTSLKYNIINDESKTYITIDNANKLKINGIKLDVEGNFKRDYQVNVINQNAETATISSGYLYNLNFKDFNVSDTYINNFSNASEKLQIVIFNNDDRPLKINDLQINYAVDKIVFEAAQGGAYKLYFGNLSAKKPQYDIEQYRNHIETQTKDACSLGKLISKVKATSQKTERDYKSIFNIVVVLISISLGAIIFSKLRIKAKSDIEKNE